MNRLHVLAALLVLSVFCELASAKHKKSVKCITKKEKKGETGVFANNNDAEISLAAANVNISAYCNCSNPDVFEYIFPKSNLQNADQGGLITAVCSNWSQLCLTAGKDTYQAIDGTNIAAVTVGEVCVKGKCSSRVEVVCNGTTGVPGTFNGKDGLEKEKPSGKPLKKGKLTCQKEFGKTGSGTVKTKKLPKVTGISCIGCAAIAGVTCGPTQTLEP